MKEEEIRKDLEDKAALVSTCLPACSNCLYSFTSQEKQAKEKKKVVKKPAVVPPGKKKG